MITTRESIAKQIREARGKRGLTQAEVSKQAEITTTYYAMIERAEVNANSDILGRIGKVLKISIKI